MTTPRHRRAVRVAAWALAIAIAALSSPGRSAAGAESAAQYLVGLSGMSCPQTCGAETLRRLQSLPGVADVDLNPNTKSALLTMSAGTGLTRSAVSQILRGGEVRVTTFEPVHHAKTE
jgi:hypothetical protein